jgi:riboflavin kinase/FMN adenylyltransferase
VLVGDVAGAAGVLGRWYRLRGLVVRGDQRGRELGFPTANLTIGSRYVIPADGVYAGWLTVVGRGAQPGAAMPSAISIGTNPTFDGEERRVEAHVLGRDDLWLYGEEVVIEFVERLRGTLRFTSADALVGQMREDVRIAAGVLARAGR